MSSAKRSVTTVSPNLVLNAPTGVSARLPDGRFVNIQSAEYRNYLAKNKVSTVAMKNQTPNINTRRKQSANAVNLRSGSRQRQLVNTYLTFAYEMRPGLPRSIFNKYLLLIMYSIDKIGGSSNNDERYSKLYEEVDTLTGTVDLNVQNRCAEIITNILKNVYKIDSSTSKKLSNLLIF